MDKNDFINEKRVGTYLEQNISTNIVGNKKYFSDTSKRPDFVLPDQKLIVEFDGIQHYTVAKTIKKDKLFEEHIKNKYPQWKLVRIPYYVQFDSETTGFYFRFPIDFNFYPHGFHNTRIAYPADFCPPGQTRFIKEMNELKINCPNCYKEIIDNLNTLSNKEGFDVIYGETRNYV